MNRAPPDDAVLAAAVAGAGDIAYVWDLERNTVAWAGDVATLFAPGTPAITSAAAWLDRLDPHDRGRRDAALARHVATGAAFDCDARLRLADGSWHWVHERARIERAADGAPRRLCGLLRLIDRRKEHEAALERRADFDRLTGLMNRDRLRGALDAALAGPARRADATVYLAIGIDTLGLVNDTMGHAAADAVVADVARRLAAAVRAEDSIGRVGGDVFGVVMPGCGADAMAATAAALLTRVRTQPVDTPSGAVHVTVSAGGVVIGADSGSAAPTDAEAVMTQAEGALHEAKRQGRDGFWPGHATSPQQSALRGSVAIGQRVRAAMQADSLSFAFQPVVDGDGRVAFYECLLNLDDGTGTPAAASAFMPAVERLGMARRVDHHTLGMAVRALRAHPEVTLSLNLSAGTTADRSWLAALNAHLAVTPDLARRLIVEITETAAIEDVEETARFVAALRRLGCRVALDDFGAGYLSYRHLRALPVDIVKIDGSFVRELADGPEALLFIRTMVGLARGFGLTTVAEGVEQGDQADLLRREGVTLLQGFLFGRPQLGAWRPAGDPPR